jgi:hypothetical protein
MGIMPAILREMGRVPTAIIYITTAAMLGVINPAMTLSIEELVALITAAAVFILLRGIWFIGWMLPEELAGRNIWQHKTFRK